jgi:hypothetical protein
MILKDEVVAEESGQLGWRRRLSGTIPLSSKAGSGQVGLTELTFAETPPS